MNIHIEALCAVIASAISSYLASQMGFEWISGAAGALIVLHVYVWAVKWKGEALQEINDLGFHIDSKKREYKLIPISE